MTLEELEKVKSRLLEELKTVGDNPERELELIAQIEVYDSLIANKKNYEIYCAAGDDSGTSDESGTETAEGEAGEAEAAETETAKTETETSEVQTPEPEPTEEEAAPAKAEAAQEEPAKAEAEPAEPAPAAESAKPEPAPAQAEQSEPAAETRVEAEAQPAAEEPAEAKEEVPDVEALFTKGSTAYEIGDYSTAYDCFLKAAELNMNKAQVRLALLYERGAGVPEDIEKALGWYKKAADLGNPYAIKRYKEIRDILDDRPEYRIIDPKVGDEVLFGTDIRGEKLRWQVLEVQDKKVLVISSYKLCNKPYHQKCEDVTWADCSLREWLNKDFYNDRFSDRDRTKIIPCTVENEDNSSFNTPGGSQTTDNVFLLSISEAKQLFSDDKARDINSRWWLRSPGSKSCFAACVGWGLYGYTGVIDAEGVRVDWFDINGSLGVRPVMWIKTDEKE